MACSASEEDCVPIPPVAIVVGSDVASPYTNLKLRRNELIIDMMLHYACAPFHRNATDNNAALRSNVFDWVDCSLPNVDVEDMISFHDESYVRYLSMREVPSESVACDLSSSHNGSMKEAKPGNNAFSSCSPSSQAPTLFPRNRDKTFNLVGNNAPFRGLWQSCKSIVSGTLTAARMLVEPSRFAAIHWFGGRKHAKRASAGGCCFVNDVVLAAMELRKLLPEGRNGVLVVDLDAHHGNGTQEAFLSDPAVVTLSLHAYGLGIYPGTGSLEEIGDGLGQGSAMNIPLPAGATDFLTVPMALRGISSAFSKMGNVLGAVIVVCGSNALRGDSQGLLNFSLGGYQKVLRVLLAEVAHRSLKVLVLGTSGQVDESSARLAGVVTRDVLSCSVSLRNGDTDYFSLSSDLATRQGVEVPETCAYFKFYGPSFLMHGLPPAFVQEVHHFPRDSPLFARMQRMQEQKKSCADAQVSTASESTSENYEEEDTKESLTEETYNEDDCEETSEEDDGDDNGEESDEEEGSEEGEETEEEVVVDGEGCQYVSGGHISIA